jgi:hypothetical protein
LIRLNECDAKHKKMLVLLYGDGGTSVSPYILHTIQFYTFWNFNKNQTGKGEKKKILKFLLVFLEIFLQGGNIIFKNVAKSRKSRLQHMGQRNVNV